MRDTKCLNLRKKESEIQSVIEDISKMLLSLFPEEAHKSVDSMEEALTPILDAIRKNTTEQYYQSMDSDHHYCEACGQKMVFKENLSRKVVGLTNYEINRRSFHCRPCDIYERPLDKVLNLSGRFTLEIRKAMLLLGQRIPFQEASDYLNKLLRVQVSDQTILTTVESAGKAVHEEDLLMVRGLLNKEGFVKQPEVSEIKKTGAAYLQMDGMMVQTREDGWKEIRNGILFSEDKRVETDKNHNWIQEKICFSLFNRNKNSLEAFKRRATAEAFHFGFEQYEKPVIIGDGAKWIWDYADEHHPEAIQILDYYHACEYLGAALGSIKISEKKKESVFDKLLEGKVVAIIAFLKTQKKTKEITDCIRYYSNHQMRMRYQLYIDQGLDIGSGAIESTHRTLIQSRMKQAGMHWKKKNVQSVASVRARVQSGRWDELVNKHLKAA